MITIKSMTILDYDAVYALWQSTEGIGLSASDSKAAIAAYLARNPGLSFIALDHTDVVGAVLCGHDGRRGFLHHLAVAPIYRKQGIARGLLDACMKELAKIQIDKCNIFLFQSNLEGKAFWQHNGWIERQDLAVMQFVLQNKDSLTTDDRDKKP